MSLTTLFWGLEFVMWLRLALHLAMCNISLQRPPVTAVTHGQLVRAVEKVRWSWHGHRLVIPHLECGRAGGGSRVQDCGCAGRSRPYPSAGGRDRGRRPQWGLRQQGLERDPVSKGMERSWPTWATEASMSQTSKPCSRNKREGEDTGCVCVLLFCRAWRHPCNFCVLEFH